MRATKLTKTKLAIREAAEDFFKECRLENINHSTDQLIEEIVRAANLAKLCIQFEKQGIKKSI